METLASIKGVILNDLILTICNKCISFKWQTCTHIWFISPDINHGFYLMCKKSYLYKLLYKFCVALWFEKLGIIFNMA